MAVVALDRDHRDLGGVADALHEMVAARPKLQPFGRSCGSGSWPGMATSGREFLSAPGSGIERNSPCV